MPDSSDFWYRLGYAVESARSGQAKASLDALARSAVEPRRKDGRSRLRKPEPDGADSAGSADDSSGEGGAAALNLLLAAGTGTIISRLLSAWPAKRRPTMVRLARAAVAGASATLLRELLEPMLQGKAELPELDEGLSDRLTAGAARGLVYGGVVDPRLPGPPIVRGITYAAAEYLLSPWGGLRAVIGKHAPYHKLPVVSKLLDDPVAGEDAFLDHLVFGLALGLLYGDGDGEGVAVRIGIGDDEV
ncbi:MAG: hypothetical protein HKN71_13305 [Gemmatimonadetes bacterium]|nr:hypothetical protein [Gemmatimonadota bacterium]